MAFDPTTFDELVRLFTGRNELTLYHLDLPEQQLQLEFNGIWFDTELIFDRF
jgi:hypothetical protein